MDAASLTTGNARRDKSVWSKGFLHIQEYPDMLFVSGRLARDGDRWLLHGKLTVRGTTAPAGLELSSAGADTGGCRFHARARIDRQAYGVGPRGILGRYLEVEFDVVGHVVSTDAGEVRWRQDHAMPRTDRGLGSSLRRSNTSGRLLSIPRPCRHGSRPAR